MHKRATTAEAELKKATDRQYAWFRVALSLAYSADLPKEQGLVRAVFDQAFETHKKRNKRKLAE
jgi:hypothetical protein